MSRNSEKYEDLDDDDNLSEDLTGDEDQEEVGKEAKRFKSEEAIETIGATNQFEEVEDPDELKEFLNWCKSENLFIDFEKVEN